MYLLELFHLHLIVSCVRLTWSLTPHSPAENFTRTSPAPEKPSIKKFLLDDLANRELLKQVSLLLAKSAPLRISKRQDLLLNRAMLSNQGCLTWVVSPATSINLQPQTRTQLISTYSTPFLLRIGQENCCDCESN